jgi:hypothetical protein
MDPSACGPADARAALALAGPGVLEIVWSRPSGERSNGELEYVRK